MGTNHKSNDKSSRVQGSLFKLFMWIFKSPVIVLKQDDNCNTLGSFRCIFYSSYFFFPVRRTPILAKTLLEVIDFIVSFTLQEIPFFSKRA